ncbi:Hsp20/alpha crystallin family protein [Neisseriaceae bacterium JH1-16]|nr:Hsp20/alpha crystallin family protein [Neisseriaceae bacterium JH1-16]
MFGDLFGQASWMTPAAWMTSLAQQSIPIDISETDVAYVVRADIPGVKKDAISVSVDGNRISINVETDSLKEEKKGATIIHSERRYDRTYRSFTLDKGINDTKVVAKYDNGVLELTLPKANVDESKKITIQ